MSGQFKGLHPYVSQCMVSLFETLAREHSEQCSTAMLEEVLRMVLEIINSCLCNQTQQNPNPIYTILYTQYDSL